MRFASLGSGSQGNATLIGSEQGYILLDCGFSRRVLMQRLDILGVSAHEIKAVLVTHEHLDHVKGVRAVAENLSAPIYSSFGTARKMDWLEHPLWNCLYNEQMVNIAGIDIQPFLVPHDAQEPFQYVFKSQGKKLGILSDLGFITPYLVEAFKQCDGLQIEANHDPEMLRKGPYPVSLQKRVAGNYGHLSNEQCAQFIKHIYWSGLKSVSLGHISEKNNSQQLVKDVIFNAIPSLEPQILTQSQPSDWQILTDKCTI